MTADSSPRSLDELIEHFDHHDPELGERAHEVYAEMLQRCPVAHSDRHGGYWIVSSYEGVHEALQDYELFTTHPSVNIPAGVGHRRPMLPLEVDPPIHVKYRSLLAPVFAPVRIAALEGKIRELCDSLIDAFIANNECDFMTQLALPLPTAIFTEMMGLPLGDADRFHNWKNVILHGHHDDPDGTKRAATGQELHAYLSELLEDRKHMRRDDIISVLIDSEVDGEKLSDEEVLDITYLLFLAGLDTVANSLALHFLHLAKHPEDRDRLVHDPGLIPDAIEEMLRYESPILGARTVTREAEFHGAHMAKGDRLLVNMTASGRDPEQFPEPDRVVFERKPNRHMAFAVGPHRCVGSHLARLEMRVVYEQMHSRIPDYRLKEGAVIHRHAGSVSGIDALPLVWGD